MCVSSSELRNLFINYIQYYFELEPLKKSPSNVQRSEALNQKTLKLRRIAKFFEFLDNRGIDLLGKRRTKIFSFHTKIKKHSHTEKDCNFTQNPKGSFRNQ